MCRINPILRRLGRLGAHGSSPASGCATALLAATIAIAQTDIKKVLAYSTVSQLGYMFLAVGVGAYWAAIFHMITHAFFKACLFLGAGSVIHGMHDEQDMRRMGGLRKYHAHHRDHVHDRLARHRRRAPFSGFWSKDEILAYALHKNSSSTSFGLIAALLTAFYMSREVFLVFFGKARWGESAEAELANLQAARRRAPAPRSSRAGSGGRPRRSTLGAIDDEALHARPRRPPPRVAVDDDGPARGAGVLRRHRRRAQPAVHREPRVPQPAGSSP